MQTQPLLVLINGEPQGRIDPTDRGLAYGDGLFETMRVESGQIPLLELHLHRLKDGCRRLGIECPETALRDDLDRLREAVSSHQRCVAKVIITRGAAGRGYLSAPGNPVTRLAMALPWPERPESWWRDGIEVWPCEARLSSSIALAGIKHLNRLEYVLARQEWLEPKIAEGLLRDQQGNFVEATTCNLFVVGEGKLFTAPLTDCGVHGIIRQLILERWKDELIPLEFALISAQRLAQADEVFLTNSLIGAWPVVKCQNMLWRPGAVCRQVQSLWDAVITCV